MSRGHLTLMSEKNKGKQCTIHCPSAHKPLPKRPPLVFYAASLSRHWALNYRQTLPTETWYFMFLGARFFSLAATKRGRHSEAREGAEKGQKNRCRQFHLSASEPAHQQLYCISRLIVATFAALSQTWSCRQCVFSMWIEPQKMDKKDKQPWCGFWQSRIPEQEQWAGSTSHSAATYSACSGQNV